MPRSVVSGPMLVRASLCFATAVLVFCGPGVAVALAQAPTGQAPDARGELVDAWVEHTLEAQDDGDLVLRYLAAPSATLLGGLFLTAPLWGELTPATDIAFVAGGAGFMTAALGAWAISDPYEAQLWYGRVASLAFTSLGVGLVALCTDAGSDCGDHPFPRHMGTSIGIINAGMFLSAFFLWTLAPPPSPQALQLSLRGMQAEQRHARVLAFLQERERLRRLGAYVSLPWGLALGGSFLVFAHDVETSEGRALMYGLGGIMLGVVTVTTIYELLRTPDSARFEAGERPED